MAGTDNPEAVSGAQPAFTFTKIAAGFPGAEGPVFSQNGAFYLVTPGNEVDGKAAGQIVKVDVSTGQVGPTSKFAGSFAGQSPMFTIPGGVAEPQ